ncbi:MAG TPA: peptidoglycan DD-metalloendopeptidase family protein [Xanthobacteraceae bacterium]|nr:peptidoglycan DD-metalloendopeptidase family protein [Xanthobacteraceae bacterium]
MVESRPLAWPRVAVLALVGIAAAGCSDSARFDSSSYTTDRPPQNVAAATPTYSAAGRVESQPLPAPSQPATVAAAPAPTYTPAAYTPSSGGYHSNAQYSDVTGSASGHWTWNGGSPVTVGQGETVESIARKHGVPVSALMQTNGIREPGQIRPGQRLVIPRYVSTSPKSAPTYAAQPKAGGSVHVVKAGETLMSISRGTGVSVAALAKTNHIESSKKLSVGDRLTIPQGGHQVAAVQPPATPKVAEPRTAPAEKKIKVASAAPVQTAHVAKEEPQTTETAVKAAEPSGAMPSFRWPARGRVIAGFGSKPNGTQNDGINIAVPEVTTIKEADDVVVSYAGNELKGYGNLVLIRHSNGYVSAYAHARELLVKRGDTIRRGQVIAHAGQTGNVTSPQLHFEIRKGSTPIDPTQFLGGA